jgi:hypothetical protein
LRNSELFLELIGVGTTERFLRVGIGITGRGGIYWLSMLIVAISVLVTPPSIVVEHEDMLGTVDGKATLVFQ